MEPPAPYSGSDPAASNAAWPNIYANVIAAIGQVIPNHGFLPAPAAWMRQGIFLLVR